MGTDSRISWTHHTFNPWRGCQKISPGCAHCYACEQWGRAFGKAQYWGPYYQVGREMAAASYWKLPEKWAREARLAGERRRVMCMSLGDVFEMGGDMDRARARLWPLIEGTQHALDWLLVTKRPACWSQVVPTNWRGVGWPDNAWVLVSAEDQRRLDERLPHLLTIPAPVVGLSCEPLLGPVSLTEGYQAAARQGLDWICGNNVQWVIVGGESGPKARLMELDWARALLADCRRHRARVWVKQLGGHPDRREAMSDMPWDLQVRELPEFAERWLVGGQA